jgi:hypothetical protein
VVGNTDECFVDALEIKYMVVLPRYSLLLCSASFVGFVIKGADVAVSESHVSMLPGNSSVD